jgi:hypothetical protein
VSIVDVYVHADGEQLQRLAGLLGRSGLEVQIAAVYPLARAAEALALVTRCGAKGAVVLEPTGRPANAQKNSARRGRLDEREPGLGGRPA